MNVQTPKGYDFRLLIKAVVKKKKRTRKNYSSLFKTQTRQNLYAETFTAILFTVIESNLCI